MNLLRCKNGHFYDGDAYTSCPHCGSQPSGDNPTVAIVTPPEGVDDDVTVALSPDEGQTVRSDAPTVRKSLPNDDQVTVSIYTDEKVQNVQKSPTVGWLVCTKGKFYGQDFRLMSGRNFIGRSKEMDICLEGENSVSRDRHATIIYEPRQNIFLAQPGESRELFYLNGEVVLSAIAIKKNDVLQIGEVSLMLIPCCDESFDWSDKE